MTFDNATGATKPIVGNQERDDDDRGAERPAVERLRCRRHRRRQPTRYPTWKQPVRAYFRQDGGSWKLVGLDRLPEQLPGNKAATKKAN